MFLFSVVISPDRLIHRCVKRETRGVYGAVPISILVVTMIAFKTSSSGRIKAEVGKDLLQKQLDDARKITSYITKVMTSMPPQWPPLVTQLPW